MDAITNGMWPRNVHDFGYILGDGIEHHQERCLNCYHRESLKVSIFEPNRH
jgi:hypothetical protein